jgi:hypothetical protein
MIVARDLSQGVKALSVQPSIIPPRSCALLAGQALECALKAFLWHRGKPMRGHELGALWERAHEAGLPISRLPPNWVISLSEGHGPNFYFRYQAGVGGVIVNGGSIPDLIPMAAGLEQLIALVELQVRANGLTDAV